MKIEFNVKEYIKAHGRPPAGQGNWIFALDREGRGEVLPTKGLTFANAKGMVAWAVRERHSADLDYAMVYLLPGAAE